MKNVSPPPRATWWLGLAMLGLRRESRNVKQPVHLDRARWRGQAQAAHCGEQKQGVSAKFGDEDSTKDATMKEPWIDKTAFSRSVDSTS